MQPPLQAFPPPLFEIKFQPDSSSGQIFAAIADIEKTNLSDRKLIQVLLNLSELSLPTSDFVSLLVQQSIAKLEALGVSQIYVVGNYFAKRLILQLFEFNLISNPLMVRFVTSAEEVQSLLPNYY